MVARVKTTNAKAASVRVKAPQTVTVSVQQVGEVLGVESTKIVEIHESTLALLALRWALYKQLCLTEGESGFQGRYSPTKEDPLQDED